MRESWAHGTILRATRYPSYYDYNLIRVEEDPRVDAGALAAFADHALAGLRHRRVDVETVEAGERLRGGFEALGWRTQRLVWMRHEASPPRASVISVEEVPYEAVRALRVAWHEEDFPGVPLGDHLAEAREVDLVHGARVLAVVEAREPVAYAQLERRERSAEIAQVYVRADHRGRGMGTAVTSAAIDAAGAVDDLWIVADDEGRPKRLYESLGFRPAWTTMELLRLPG